MRFLAYVLILLVVLLPVQLVTAQTEFKKGVNFTEWFQAPGPKQIQFTKFTKQDFINVKRLGCDVVRLPINLDYMTNGAPNYTLDPLFYSFLDQVVDWAEELNIHLVLDNHTFDVSADTDPSVGPILVKVWKQMAEHYKNRSTYIYYEIRNEPHGISAAAWNTIQQNVINAIRSVDTKHTIVVGGANYNSFMDLKDLAYFNDTNLIYTFHFYDPFVFTHQAASWPIPSLAPLTGVPFPYNAAQMPACPPSLKGSWIENAINNYSVEGTQAHIRALIDTVAKFKARRNVKVWCGEFGVYMDHAPEADRVIWYETVRKAMEEKNIPWTIWDYTNAFGLFKKGSSELFDYDLNIPLVSALGLTVPEQKVYIMRPDSVGFNLYTEYIGPSIIQSSNAAGGTIDYYAATAPAEGNYSIYWTNVDRYTHIGFDFRPNKDLTQLAAKNYALDFWVKGKTPGTSFDVRFIDTKTSDPADHPWRMGTTINQTVVEWDGKWQHVHIPLKNFVELGSWDNAWFNPEGKYNWAAVDRFEIVAEQGDLKGKEIWFDNIRVIDTLGVLNPTPVTGLEEFGKKRFPEIYPNPTQNTYTTIRYEVEKAGQVEISIYNNLGQKVCTVLNTQQTPGVYTINWDAGSIPSGLYHCRIKNKSYSTSYKLFISGK